MFTFPCVLIYTVLITLHGKQRSLGSEKAVDYMKLVSHYQHCILSEHGHVARILVVGRHKTSSVF